MTTSAVLSQSITFSFIVFAFLMISAAHGRPLKEGSSSSSSSSRFHGNVARGFEVILKDTSIGAMKNSGPSQRGGGHQLIAAIKGNKELGPSPGSSGHRLDEQLTTTTGGIKDSGPSPGEGHSSVSGNKP